jgi:hypothetical protein
LSLDIPLNDTGSAGLGVSVKGKTITIPEQGTRDLGTQNTQITECQSKKRSTHFQKFKIKLLLDRNTTAVFFVSLNTLSKWDLCINRDD